MKFRYTGALLFAILAGILVGNRAARGSEAPRTETSEVDRNFIREHPMCIWNPGKEAVERSLATEENAYIRKLHRESSQEETGSDRVHSFLVLRKTMEMHEINESLFFYTNIQSVEDMNVIEDQNKKIHHPRILVNFGNISVEKIEDIRIKSKEFKESFTNNIKETKDYMHSLLKVALYCLYNKELKLAKQDIKTAYDNLVKSVMMIYGKYSKLKTTSYSTEFMVSLLEEITCAEKIDEEIGKNKEELYKYEVFDWISSIDPSLLLFMLKVKSEKQGKCRVNDLKYLIEVLKSFSTKNGNGASRIDEKKIIFEDLHLILKFILFLNTLEFNVYAMASYTDLWFDQIIFMTTYDIPDNALALVTYYRECIKIFELTHESVSNIIDAKSFDEINALPENFKHGIRIFEDDEFSADSEDFEDNIDFYANLMNSIVGLTKWCM